MMLKPNQLATMLAIAFSTLPAAWGMVADNQGDIHYLTGGIGQDEARALRQEAPYYDLALTFTVGSAGEYAADVNVVLKNRAGAPVLTARSDGPMLFMDLPPGRYTLEATFEGRTLTRQLTIGRDQHRDVMLRWPETEAG